jgi:cell division GTPase FtsZ
MLFITVAGEGDISGSGKVPVVAGIVRKTSMRSLVV